MALGTAGGAVLLMSVLMCWVAIFAVLGSGTTIAIPAWITGLPGWLFW